MTRFEILEKTREVLKWKCIPYETYKQIRGIVDLIVELEDPISKEIENHKEEIRKLEEIRKKEEEWKTILVPIGNQKMDIWCLSLFKTHTDQNSSLRNIN